jgi:formyl-CoA transferase
VDNGILSGIRVVDCGTYIAGPAAAVVMSDFGAEVIKIERPPYGDPYRYLSLVPGMPVSPLPYCWILDGRNKKSVALDLNDHGARQALLAIIRSADVFITNYQGPLVQKFRVAYQDLVPHNPRLIYAHLTGYGETGDDSNQPGYDMTAYWARSGLMQTMYNADAEPAQSPVRRHHVGALSPRDYRARDEHHNVADGAWANACSIQAALVGAEFLPKWTRSTTVNPIVNHYVIRDQRRFITCCLDPKKDWPNLCRALDHPELIDDPRFRTPELRRANSAELVAIIDASVGSKDMAEWKEILRSNDVIWGPVPGTQQAARDPQMEANGVFAEIQPGLRTVANPLTIAGVEKTKPRMAPEVGEHTAEVLLSVGLTEEAIHGLFERGAALDSSKQN